GLASFAPARYAEQRRAGSIHPRLAVSRGPVPMLVAGPQPDRSPPPEEDAAPADSSPAESAADRPAPEHESIALSLEDRVRRLEDVIAALQLASPDWIETTRDGRPRKEPPSTSITASPP